MLKRFLDYIEIKTKITTFFVFIMSLSYLFYLKQPINWTLTGIFFAAMFLFDLTTTAINNYVDTKTNTQTLQFSRPVALAIIYILFFVSAALGLYLAFLTDAIVLIIGICCFICGVLYTYGPLPISRMPLGELFAGFFQGFLVPFLMMYINMPHGYFLTAQFGFSEIGFVFQVKPILSLALVSTASFFTIANIMYANNICDLEADVAVNRFTLAFYLKKYNLPLFAFFYYIIYFAAILLVLCKIFSPLYLLFIVSIIPVQKNIGVFFKKQEKESTFMCSIKNYLIIMCSHIIMIFVAALFN